MSLGQGKDEGLKKLAYLLLAVALLAALVAYPGCGKKASNVQTPAEFSVPDVPTLPQSATTTQPQTEPAPQDQATYEEPEPVPTPTPDDVTTEPQPEPAPPPDSEPCPT
jgi:outer membrane biosynthesis protein TonB